MDSFFGIGLPELLVILTLAGLIMGPHRIRQVARTLGRITAQLQRVSKEFARQLNAELDAVDSGDVKGALSDVRDLQREVEALRRELAEVPRSLRQEGEAIAQEGEELLQESQAALEGKSVVQESGSNGRPEIQPEDEKSAEKSRLPRAIDVPGDPE